MGAERQIDRGGVKRKQTFFRQAFRRKSTGEIERGVLRTGRGGNAETERGKPPAAHTQKEIRLSRIRLASWGTEKRAFGRSREALL